jgi:hypothetical protein
MTGIPSLVEGKPTRQRFTMYERFLDAAIQRDVKALGRLIQEREDVLHWRNENGETVADEYRRLLGTSADRRITMLLAPPFEPEGFEPEGFEPEGFVMPTWFFTPGGWDLAGVQW